MTKKKEEKKPIDWRIVSVAILCLTGLGIASMHYGINGKVFALIVGVISALAGLSLPQLKLRGH